MILKGNQIELNFLFIDKKVEKSAGKVKGKVQGATKLTFL